jgi:hypothetical protein
MRKIIKPGKALRTLECPDCGQVERQTEDECIICLNCGSEMRIVGAIPEAPEKVEDKPEPILPKAVKVLPEPAQRGPKPKRCRTCAKAMATVNNMYTCRETMTLKNAGDTCKKWVKGIPVGERK